MTIDYNWVCTACGSTNAARTNRCHACGCPAVTSGQEAAAWSRGDRRPPLGPVSRAVLVISGLCMVAGTLIVRASSPLHAVWFVGIGLLGAMFVGFAVVEKFRRR